MKRKEIFSQQVREEKSLQIFIKYCLNIEVIFFDVFISISFSSSKNFFLSPPHSKIKYIKKLFESAKQQIFDYLTKEYTKHRRLLMCNAHYKNSSRLPKKFPVKNDVMKKWDDKKKKKNFYQMLSFLVTKSMS